MRPVNSVYSPSSYNSYEPANNANNSVGGPGTAAGSNTRSSWAGLPTSVNNGHHQQPHFSAININSGSSGSSSSIGSSGDCHNTSSSTLTLTLASPRRDDAATPIVEECGRIRSRATMLGRQSATGSLDSCGSSTEDFLDSHNNNNNNNNNNGRNGVDDDDDDEDDDDCDGVDGTPSPSDSGVAELEALLKEKDGEIGLLRETLEQNEAVIFQVYQEKERSWERELKKLRSIFEERMRSAQQQASQAERQLQVRPNASNAPFFMAFDN